ncbi:MAG: phage terminase large subunit family protein, partial [Planctomycetes bacterium]|nr:phage terminase large subunit family protein [Planctomycetota bacterium]
QRFARPSADEIAAKLSGYPRRLVPSAATKLTGFIDVQKRLLYWIVVAWTDEFTGWIVDYGTFPDQKRPVFSRRDAPIIIHTIPISPTTPQSAPAWTRKLCGLLTSSGCLIDLYAR